MFSVTGCGFIDQLFTIPFRAITVGCCQWRLVALIEGWNHEFCYLVSAAVGLNGEFVHTAQLGAKHLNRKRIHRQSMRKASQLDR